MTPICKQSRIQINVVSTMSVQEKTAGENTVNEKKERDLTNRP